jgi:hypothetical protein
VRLYDFLFEAEWRRQPDKPRTHSTVVSQRKRDDQVDALGLIGQAFDRMGKGTPPLALKKSGS